MRRENHDRKKEKYLKLNIFSITIFRNDDSHRNLMLNN